MKIIGKYVLKEHVGPFLFASTALTSLMLLQYIAKRLGELVGKGLPVSVILEFLGLSLPFTIAMTLPMAVLVAVLYAFSRLAAENEINAMKASGVSMWTVLAPVLLGGLAMSALMLAFNDQVLSRSNHRLATLQLDIFRTKPTFALREQVMNTVKEGQLYLRAGQIDEATSKMNEVVIYDLGDPARRRTIYADSGYLALAPNHRDLDLTLFDGEMLTVPNKDPSELTRLFFDRDRLRVKSVFNSYQESDAGSTSKSDREMSVCEMQEMVSRADLQVQQAEHDARLVTWESGGSKGERPERPKVGRGTTIATAYCGMLSALSVTPAQAQTPGQSATAAAIDTAMIAARLQEANVRKSEARRERNRYDVEIQKKFSLAAACTIFVLIGAPIALRFPRGGVGLVIGVSFGIFGLYYVGLIGGETLADKDYLPPWLAMWAANIILAGVGILLAVRMGRESSTSRGGDFGEMMLLARAKTLGWARRFGINVERRRK
ncbi:MAG TPA: LptF/LptG family permease [Thermoanaerobaculia bacterium]|nr:LptF/LptG family permease [Thermoanaerobaculia bacterium]